MFDDLVSDEIKNKKKETYIKETLPSYLKKLDDVAKENGGYLANKKVLEVIRCTARNNVWVIDMLSKQLWALWYEI